MADGNRCIRVRRLLRENQGEGATDDPASTQYHHVGSVDPDATADKKFMDPGRGARNETGWISIGKLANVQWMKAIDILGRTDGCENLLLRNLRW
jgi:hypothetical protein